MKYNERFGPTNQPSDRNTVRLEWVIRGQSKFRLGFGPVEIIEVDPISDFPGVKSTHIDSLP